jgi:hypothetical protein
MKIRYQKQLDLPGNRMCGAAALCMVYDSLGIKTSQQEIWPGISVRDFQGNKYAKTYLMCADALKRGLNGMIIQAKDPWAVLKLCTDDSIRAILIHRLNVDSTLGHFTVLVDVTSRFVTLHDPELGPYRKIDRNKMLSLWLKTGNNCEIEDNVLIAISNKDDSERTSCKLCGTAVPKSTQCPNQKCNKDIPLRPLDIVGCMDDACPGRTWRHIICPYCDTPLSRI